jgi:hypothetical protein
VIKNEEAMTRVGPQRHRKKKMVLLNVARSHVYTFFLLKVFFGIDLKAQKVLLSMDGKL